MMTLGEVRTILVDMTADHPEAMEALRFLADEVEPHMPHFADVVRHIEMLTDAHIRYLFLMVEREYECVPELKSDRGEDDTKLIRSPRIQKVG